MKVFYVVCLLAICCSTCFSQAESNQSVVPQLRTQQDTVKALEHLYKRKRSGGITRGVVLGIFTAIPLISIIAYQPEYVTFNGQKILINDSPESGYYIITVAGAIVTITGFAQAGKYNHDHLTIVLNDLNAGKGLPPNIRKKLKSKDFQ